MSSQVVCNGCNGSFSHSGYSMHLNKTTKPSCKAIYHALHRSLSGITASEPQGAVPSTSYTTSSDAPLNTTWTTTSAVEDFFGTDYTPEELGYETPQACRVGMDIDVDAIVEDPHSGDDMNDFGMPPLMDISDASDEEDEHHPGPIDDSDEDIPDDLLEPHWEPPPSTLLPEDNGARSSAIPITTTNEPPVISTATASLPCAPEIVHFTKGKAGAPVDCPKQPSTYQAYRQNLANSVDAQAHAQNPWAPFGSKLDWEIARWAKLRGPGSTAFSELLAIEGVRIVHQEKRFLG